jgi:ATP-dependent Clp protease adaptor protein ClpS
MNVSLTQKMAKYAEIQIHIQTDFYVNFASMNSNQLRSAYQEETTTDVLEITETTELMELVVFNDDFNTFEHVIHTLIKVCRHSVEQAEQCTWIIHYRGRCTVKKGTFDFLKPMRDAICEAGIDAKIL